MDISLCLDSPDGDFSNLVVVIEAPRGFWGTPAEGGVVAGSHGALVTHYPEQLIGGAVQGRRGEGRGVCLSFLMDTQKIFILINSLYKSRVYKMTRI